MVTPLAIFSAGSFLCYGVSCLCSAHMREEFVRFGLARQRTLTGWLQLTGAVGLLFGLREPMVGCIAAGGLSLLMLLGFGLRIKIRDGVLRSSPALLYMLLNLFLSLGFAART